MRSLLCCLFAACLCVLGSAQTTYSERWQKTLGSADNDRNPKVLARVTPVVAYERVQSVNAISVYAVCLTSAGVVMWTKNLSGANPTRNALIWMSDSGPFVYIGVRRSTGTFTSQTVIYCIDGNSGNPVWTFTSANDRTPRAIVLDEDDIVVAAQSFAGNGYALRINSDTGTLSQEVSLHIGGDIKSGAATVVNGQSRPHFVGSKSGRPAIWTVQGGVTTANDFTVGTDGGEFRGVSENGRHAFGVTRDSNGISRPLHATLINGTWSVVTMNQPIVEGGFVSNYTMLNQIVDRPTRYRATYVQSAGTDKVHAIEHDDDGFARIARTIDIGATSSSRVGYGENETYHFYANLAGTSRLIGLHPTLPIMTLNRLNEITTNAHKAMVVGTYETPAGDTNIVIRNIGLPALPAPISVYDIPTRTLTRDVHLNYNLLPLQTFGAGNTSLSNGFDNGSMVSGNPSYYQPNVNYVGTDISIWNVGAQSATAQFVVNVGLTPRVLGISFKNLGEVVGGRTLEAKLTISRAAESGGLAVPLSTNSTLISVPVTVTVPGGKDSVTFLVSSEKVFENAVRKVNYGSGPNDNVDVTIIPGGLNTFNIGPTTVQGGATATGSVSLTGPIPTYLSGATFAITANGGSVTFPASVTLGPGMINKTFTINTTAVVNTVVRTFTVTQGVTQRTATLTITP